MSIRRYTLGEIKKDHPDAFKELASMDLGHKNILLFLLSGMTTSPVGRGYADIEVDKEDAIISALRVNHCVEITSKRAHGNYCYHIMTTEQIKEFFNDREAMRKRVSKAVWAKRTSVLDRALRKAIKWRGATWLINRINELAANDWEFSSSQQKEPKQ
ncbi:hypothetical protein AN944_02638 [Shewanella sp. P1-14-1]|uniref:hypothetical protein n=1 Tax=Shewanella sp. P1-14-1 TaxID=1723761 RepID=UPI0006D65A39|nr:hypothetical protein [Shewanella sp. P1-14-1]KPZ69942.1 hypothetical protein AN944_02638 [Shewanella sp. P1-14-1]